MENEKMFTQDEVNTIVQERLAKEKAKYEKLIAEKETEYAKKEKYYLAKDELSKRGIPVELAELVRLDNDDAFNSSIALLENNYKPVTTPQPIVSGRTPENRGRTTPQRESFVGDPIKKAMGL